MYIDQVGFFFVIFFLPVFKFPFFFTLSLDEKHFFCKYIYQHILWYFSQFLHF